jgi:hypothetical protein
LAVAAVVVELRLVTQVAQVVAAVVVFIPRQQFRYLETFL